MASRGLLLTVVACALTGVHGSNATIYDFYLDMVYNRVDELMGNNDGKIQCGEFKNFTKIMDLTDLIPDSEVNTHCANADTDSDGGITRDEIINYVTSGAADAGYSDLGDKVVNRLIGAPNDGETTISTDADPDVEAAKAIVDVEITCNGSPESLLPEERKTIKANLIREVAPGTPPNTVFVRFLSGSMVVKAKFFLPDTSAAAAAKTNAETNLATPAAASLALSANLAVPITVTAAPVVEQSAVLGVAELEYTIPAAVGGIAAFLLVFSCVLASCVAKSKRKRLGHESKGCCATGCCSGYAMTGWAWAVLFGCVFLAAGAALLYLAMDDTTQGVKCILDNIVELTNLPAGSDAREAVGSIDSSLEYIDPVRDNIDLLNIAVILPAVFAILLLLVGALCSCRSSSTACCAKVFMLLSCLVLLLCIVFYSIFAGLAVAVQFEEVTSELTIVTTLCETTLPTLEQTFTDLTNTLARAATLPAGAISADDIRTYSQKLADATPAFEIFQDTCDCISAIFNEFVDLFIPGVVSVLAAVVCFVANFYLCCAAGCCKSPNVASGKGAPAEPSQSV